MHAQGSLRPSAKEKRLYRRMNDVRLATNDVCDIALREDKHHKAKRGKSPQRWDVQCRRRGEHCRMHHHNFAGIDYTSSDGFRVDKLYLLLKVVRPQAKLLPSQAIDEIPNLTGRSFFSENKVTEYEKILIS